MAEHFFPVPLKRIVVDSVPNFDLYIKQKERFVLYRKANYRFEKENLNNLMDNNIESLYVSKKDLKLYEEYRARIREAQEESARKQGYEGIFVDPEEVDRYHDIFDNYHAVEESIFAAGMEVDFPIYYHEGNELILCEDFEGKEEGPWELTDKFAAKGRELKIRVEDIPKYRAFVQKVMQDTTGYEVERKALVLQEMTKLTVKDVLDNPRSGEKIKELNHTVNNLVDFLLQNETSYYSLLMISAHDFYTYTHSINVCTLSVGLGSEYGLAKSPDLEILGLGAMLHDIGKSQIDSKLINKPGKLTPAEFTTMKNHVLFGVEILKKNHNLPEEVLEPVAQHHEKLTGVGYPKGLRGDEISLFGRIASIVDIYDALTTKRAYKPALSPFEALSFLSRTENDYDRALLRHFILMLGKQIEQKRPEKIRWE